MSKIIELNQERAKAIKTVEGLRKKIEAEAEAWGWVNFTYSSSDVSSAMEEWKGCYFFAPELAKRVAKFDPWTFQHGKGGAYGQHAEFLAWVESLQPDQYVEL